MSSRTRVLLGGVGAGLVALALLGDLGFLVVHDAELHLDVRVVLGLAGLLAGFAVLGLCLSLLLQGLGQRRAEVGRADAEEDPVEQERIDRAP